MMSSEWKFERETVIQQQGYSAHSQEYLVSRRFIDVDEDQRYYKLLLVNDTGETTRTAAQVESLYEAKYE